MMLVPRPSLRARLASMRLGAFVAAVAAASVAVTLHLAHGNRPTLTGGPLATLPIFVVLLVAGESLLIRFRFREQVETVNLMEAVLAPLLYGFSGPVVVGAVLVAQVTSAIIRRNRPIKATFNVAQWTLAAGAGSFVVSHGASSSTLGSLGYLVAALAVVGVTNQLALTGVLAVSSGSSPREVLRSFAAMLVPNMLVSWGANVLLGILFALAFAKHAGAVVLFPLPLIALYLAYRSAATARTDRQRIAGVQRAMANLTDPVDGDPTDFLRCVASGFDADHVALALVEDGDIIVHWFDHDNGTSRPQRCHRDDNGLVAAVFRAGGSGHVRSGASSPIAAGLAADGRKECVFAVADSGTIELALLVTDQFGLDAPGRSDDEVLAALAREASALLEKNRLLKTVLDERQRLADIVSSTSDGILTLAEDGTVRTWNPAFERITGLTAAAVIGRADAIETLHPRTLDGRSVELHRWADGRELPREFRITGAFGETRRLACSYSRLPDAHDGDVGMVLIARDTTPVEEMETLRAQFGRLAEAEAVQRDIVDRLQQAVMPLAQAVPGTDVEVRYVSSDPASPTGGDLYDWHILPDGDVHLAVVDVLGHGVDATRDALAVIHALRVLAIQGCPLDRLVREANALLATQQPELVATVMVCRYRPADGTVEIASGGHPAPLLASRYGGVREVEVSGGAIGWPLAGSVEIAVCQLEPGDSLLVYTDGVVEAGKDILVGTRRLIQDADQFAHLPADEYTSRLLDRALCGASRRDDSLLLTLRRQLPAARTRRWQLSPDANEVRRVRHELAAFASRCGVHDDDIDRLELVTSELLTNAMRAAQSTVDVELRVGAQTGELTVEDDGRGFEPATEIAYLDLDLDAESGRGLPIVSLSTDRLTILPSEEGTVVRASLEWGERIHQVRDLVDVRHAVN